MTSVLLDGPYAIGLNVTLIRQLEPVMSADPQLLDCENGPLAAIEDMVTVPGAEFVSVTVSDALAVPTTCPGKTKLAVESEATGPVVPVPFSRGVRAAPFCTIHREAPG